MAKKIKKKILVVDDEAMVTKILSKRLDAYGYDTYNAFDGKQCIQIARKIRPDLIVLDIVIPYGDGIDTYKKLKLNSETENIPIIFVTAYDDEETKSQISELKPEGFFVKPFDGSKLLERINELI
jgi:DNA-binding response OmpR family regulator